MSLLLCVMMIGFTGSEPAFQTILDRGLPELPTGVRVVWEIEQHAGVTPDELMELRRRIAGRPDHPDRPKAEVATRRLNSGPDRLRREAWIDRAGRFRLSETPAKGGWNDVVVADGVVWALTADSLNIVDGSREPPPGRNFAATRDDARRHIGGFMMGGLSMIIGAPRATAASFRRSGREWTASAFLPDNIGSFWFRGTEVDHNILVTEGRVERLAPAPAEVGARVKASDLWPDSPLGPVFRVIEGYRPSGVLDSRSRLIEAEVWSSEPAMFAVPDRARPRDAVRGELALLHVADFRDDRSGRFWQRGSADEAFEKGPPPPNDPSRTIWSLNRSGYLILIGVGVLIAGVWLRRR